MSVITEFQEFELKYFADNIKLTDFNKLMLPLNPLSKKDISSWDTYYTKENNEDEFQRYRESDKPELTKKVKVKETNNWKRVESDLPLDPNRITEEKVSFHVGLDGYKKNFKIYKTCFIFWFEKVNTVYYITYDENLKELNRFIEIEVNKNSGLTEDQAFSILKEYENKLEILGITNKNRLKRSLFELFRK